MGYYESDQIACLSSDYRSTSPVGSIADKRKKKNNSKCDKCAHGSQSVCPGSIKTQRPIFSLSEY